MDEATYNRAESIRRMLRDAATEYERYSREANKGDGSPIIKIGDQFVIGGNSDGIQNEVLNFIDSLYQQRIAKLEKQFDEL